MSRRPDRPLTRGQSTPGSIMSSIREDNEADQQRNAALERIFHPDKFDIKQLNPGSESNVDLGAKFYTSHTETSFLDLDDGSGSQDEGASFSIGGTTPSDHEAEVFKASPTIRRTVSLIEEPVADMAAQQQKPMGSLSSFQVYLRSVEDHHVENYAHPHHVMHRMKQKAIKRAETEQEFRQHHIPGGRKIKSNKGHEFSPSTGTAKSGSGSSSFKVGSRKPSEGAIILPTMIEEDMEKDGRTSSVSVDPILEETSENTDTDQRFKGHQNKTYYHEDTTTHDEASETDDTSKKKGKGASFSIAPDSDPETDQDTFSIKGRSRRESVESFWDQVSSTRPALEKRVSFTHTPSAASSMAEDSRDEEVHENDEEKLKKRRKRRKHRHVPFEEDIVLRRTKGSELHMDEHVLPTEEDEARTLASRDVEDMAHHRMDHIHSTRHLVKKKSSIASVHIRGIQGLSEEKIEKMNKIVDHMFGAPIAKLDHTPHDLFVEMDELRGSEWVEMNRWIKYEETREEGSERWGKPHISSLSFHSLINLRLCLESGVILLDLEATDFSSVVHRVVEEFSMEDLLEEGQKGLVLKVLLYKHNYVEQRTKYGGLMKSSSTKSLKTLMQENDVSGHFKAAMALAATATSTVRNDDLENGAATSTMDADALVSGSSHQLNREPTNADLFKAAQTRKESILKRLKGGTEGAIVLAGALDELTSPLVAFVRLAEGIIMPNALEVPLPMRFMFFVLTPKSSQIDFHEVGRSFSTLMSNPKFHNVCYGIEERRELLSAINEFLDESVVLPPGDWESKNLLSISEIQEMRKRRKDKKGEEEEKKKREEMAAKKLAEADDESNKKYGNPMVRTKMPFGGIMNDIKRRYPHYLSDFIDGLNIQAISATIFIYFACLSGAVAFGGLMGDKTENLIGIPVTLMVSCVAGILFALLAGCPLIIIGVTGPVLLFDEALYQFSKSNELEFLPWRVWIGIWILIIALLVACFQGSTLVKHFTKFTKDIFAALVALLFIYEAVRKLYVIFGNHPLMSRESYCNATEVSKRVGRKLDDSLDNDLETSPIQKVTHKDEPNTALLSAILMFGTFFIAYFLRIFRNGKYLGRTIRRALGDFGVPIAIVITVLLDFLIHDTYTQKLDVPNGLQVTAPDKRGWLVSPLGYSRPLPIWAPFAAAIPAILLYLLLFMETHICELIMMEKTNKKGCGLHLDIFLLCLINCLGSFFGGPWICAATVRAVSHVSALSVLSTTHAPGETAKIVDVRDQRISGLVVSIMVGASVLLAPILQFVPFAVLFGVFLYMGVSSINGIQLFDRVSLLFMPVKHHPQVSYVRRVKTWKMHMFTIIQLIGLAILWVVKSTQLALFFPFFVVAMIPYRLCLKFFYTPMELDALDGPKAGQIVLVDDEPDFYDQAYGS